MRRLSATLTFTFLLFFSAVAQEKSDREKANLLGPVRSVRSETIEYKDATLKQRVGIGGSESVTYDEKGNELERNTSLIEGSFASKEVRTYDTTGKLIGSVSSAVEGAHERRVYLYEGGKLIRLVSYDANGKVESEQSNSYGKDGRLLEEKYVVGKRAFGKTVFKYDQIGNLSEMAFYLPDGKKSLAVIGPCVGTHRVIYTYNDERKPIKITHSDPDGEVKWSWEYAYDSKGMLTNEIAGYLSTRQSFVYAYEYDSRGNWIRKIATKDLGVKDPPSSTVSVTSREISYY